MARSFPGAVAVALLAVGVSAQAAVPGITGVATQTALPVIAAGGKPTFNLAASPSAASMPDGGQVYTWNYGCGVAPTAATPGAAPVALAPAGTAPNNLSVTPTCGLAQLPGPTMIVTEGDAVTVNLYNGLPTVAGNTSIVFSGFSASCIIPGATPTACPQGLVTSEAAPGTTVTYTFTANRPGTYAYYSGSRSELQVEMGLYGALIVLPAHPVSGTGATGCSMANPTLRELTAGAVGGIDYRLSTSAYDHASTCYDREFLFQFAEMDSDIHNAALSCVLAGATTCAQINVVTDPYHPNYFLINGRSFPDDEDANFSPMYPNQPYNGNPQIHPGESMLLRVIGQGRNQHPFHIHANHGRIIARDGNMLLAATKASELAGPLYYTIPTVSGQSQDVLFTYTGKGVNWDIYGHSLSPWAIANIADPTSIGPSHLGTTDPTPCFPDTNGYYTQASGAPVGASNYFEWCADHNKPIPITPPDPQIVANGLWYGGTPYLGLTTVPLNGGSPQFLSTPLPPGANIQNSTGGYAFMWHSHAERELTSNDVFPGGMLMMLVVQPPVHQIDETL
jgi:FtsP/CotA-like multicopper oxidase with cupredoxin domain